MGKNSSSKLSNENVKKNTQELEDAKRIAEEYYKPEGFTNRILLKEDKK